jgi:hypothetical protein
MNPMMKACSIRYCELKVRLLPLRARGHDQETTELQTIRKPAAAQLQPSNATYRLLRLAAVF